MSAAGLATAPSRFHWLWRLPAWVLLSLVQGIVLWTTVGLLDTWLLRQALVDLPTWFSFFVPTAANLLLAWKLKLLGWRSAGAIVASVALFLLSLTLAFFALALLFPLDHIINGPH